MADTQDDGQNPKPGQDQEQGLVQVVSALHSVHEQLGGHVMGALQRPNTVAVLSTILPGLGPARVVSIPLNPAQFQAIQVLLTQGAAPERLSAAARKAIGFGRAGEEEEE